MINEVMIYGDIFISCLQFLYLCIISSIFSVRDLFVFLSLTSLGLSLQGYHVHL